MRVRDIQLLFEYNTWAKERILAAAEQLTAEQLRAPNDLGWGDLQGMLVHILDAEYGWRNNLTERADLPWLVADDFAGLAEIRERWDHEDAALRLYLDSLSDDDLDGSVDYEVKGETRYWVRWHCLVHMVNHGTQHRSESAALLTLLGQSPGDMDFSLFLYERYGRSDFPRAEGETFAYQDIALLFRYNDWANDRILDRAEGLTGEQFSAESEFGWGSFRGTLVHLMDAEYSWRRLLEDAVFVEELKPKDFVDVNAIRAHWAGERAALWRYLNSLSDADMTATVSYEAEGERRYRLLWQCLAHLVNHGTQHRAECAAMLTGFGQSPGNLDLTVFLREHSA